MHPVTLGIFLLLWVQAFCADQTILFEDNIHFSFGSCNGQEFVQPLWQYIQDPLFVFLGDAVYAPNGSLAGLEDAYAVQQANPDYQAFVERTPYVVGTWDDHDFGVNDAGKLLPDKPERQSLFLDFLAVPEDSPLRAREGLYSSLALESEDGLRASLLLLDTRTFRDSHWIRSLGEIPLPLTPILAALVRTFSSLSNLDKDHDGDMLGEEQWRWLERELQQEMESESATDVLVIGSSVQVFTTNPLVESWGHFPKSKERLLGLLKKYVHPSTPVVFLSGDVHEAELSEVFFSIEEQEQEQEQEGSILEITSSGLTHTCTGPLLYGWTCNVFNSIFNQHRRAYGDWFTGLNFGSLRLEREDGCLRLRLSAMGLTNPKQHKGGVEPKLAMDIPFCPQDIAPSARMGEIRAPAFIRSPPFVLFTFLVLLALLLFALLYILPKSRPLLKKRNRKLE